MVVEHQQQPTSVVVPEAVVQQRGCCCSVPSNVSSAVKNTRRVSIAIIIIHIIALYFLWPLSSIGSAIGIVMGSVVLCSLTKCTYRTASILYILGSIVDLCTGCIMIVVMVVLNSSSNEEINGSIPIGQALLLIVTSLLGGLAFLAGSVFAFMAVGNWEQSGALRALPVDVEHSAAVSGLQVA